MSLLQSLMFAAATAAPVEELPAEPVQALPADLHT